MLVLPWRPVHLLLTFVLAGSAAVGTVFQAVAQAGPPLGAAQIVPFRPTATGAPTAGPAGAAGEKAGTVWLQFINTDIATVARSLGAMTGRQVLVDTRVEDTLNLQSTQAVSPSVAWDMFTQALNQKKLAILPSQGMYIISPQANTGHATGSDSPAKAGPMNKSAPNDHKRDAAKSSPEEFEISVEWASSRSRC